MSRIRFPPPPKADKQMNVPRAGQFGAAPAIIAKTEHMKSEVLKQNRRPITSAL